MADKSMGAKELDAIKERLIERKKTLREEILFDLESDATGEHRELIDTIKENGDLGTEELRQDNAFTLIELKYDELKNIEQGIERIEEGKYGQCLDCKEQIGWERLKAVPYAIRCRDCQARYEKWERQVTTT